MIAYKMTMEERKRREGKGRKGRAMYPRKSELFVTEKFVQALHFWVVL